MVTGEYRKSHEEPRQKNRPENLRGGDLQDRTAQAGPNDGAKHEERQNELAPGSFISGNEDARKGNGAIPLTWFEPEPTSQPRRQQ